MSEAERAERKRVHELRATYRQANWRCELRDTLERFDPPGWGDYRSAVYGPDRNPFELHHIFGKGFEGCESEWNYLMVCPAAHDFCTGGKAKIRDADGRVRDAGTSRIGRALCLIAKADKGEINFAEVGRAPGYYPLGVLANEAAGTFYGPCEDLKRAVFDLVAKHAFPEPGPSYGGFDVDC